MKALFIGAGGIATHHLNAMRALGVDVIGIYDVNSERAEALSSEYHISTTDNYYQTAKDADMVYLLTPPSTRLQYIKELSEVCKNIFVEKQKLEQLMKNVPNIRYHQPIKIKMDVLKTKKRTKAAKKSNYVLKWQMEKISTVLNIQ